MALEAHVLGRFHPGWFSCGVAKRLAIRKFADFNGCLLKTFRQLAMSLALLGRKRYEIANNW